MKTFVIGLVLGALTAPASANPQTIPLTPATTELRITPVGNDVLRQAEVVVIRG